MELVCIKCGEVACIQLDLSDGDTFRCPECEDDFTLAEVEAAVGNWQRVVAWVKLHPARQPSAVKPHLDQIQNVGTGC